MNRKILITFMALLMMMPMTAQASTKERSMGLCKITAYCPCEKCSEGYGRQTSTQHTAISDHTVAVDPDVIGYGLILQIGKKAYVAEDCGSRVLGEHIDIFMDTHEEVEEFGVKYKKVLIVGKK